jgi:hypothetical protein
VTWRLSNPPKALRRRGIRLDNVALVPGNLLPYKREWQAVANGLPHGSVLICIPTSPGTPRRQLTHVADELRAKGRSVTTVPAERFVASDATSVPPLS